MKKVFYFFIIMSVVGTPMMAATTNKDCPNCPKPTTTAKLDPGWKKFVPPPLAPGERPDCHRVQFGKQNCMNCHKNIAEYNGDVTAEYTKEFYGLIY